MDLCSRLPATVGPYLPAMREGGTVVFEDHVLKFAMGVNVMKEFYAARVFVCVCVFYSGWEFRFRSLAACWANYAF